MKIVVTSRGETLQSAVDPRFGRATWFILYDVDTNLFESVSNTQNLNAPQGAGIQAAETVSPAVVTVVAKLERTYDMRELRGVPRELLDELDDSIGSGVIIHSSGVLLTNSHVIAGADKVVVRTSDGREFDTYDVKQDPLSDVAILKIKDAPRMPAAPLGNSDGMEIGDWVIAIGSPFELEATVSAGIISARGRSISRIPRSRLLQTDAAINPGNSGGPLVSLNGTVVGINTAIATNNGGYQGVGFAIPANQAKWIVDELLEHGEVRGQHRRRF